MSHTHAIKHAYRSSSRRSFAANIALPKGIGLLNIALVGLAVLFLTYYILQANVMAGGMYKIKTSQDKLLSLQEKNTALLSERSLVEDPSEIEQFARSHNMVSAAKDVTYLFESNNVALGDAR